MEKTEEVEKKGKLWHIENMPRGTYLVDMDGVLFDYAGKFAEMWNKAYHETFGWPKLDSKTQKFFYMEDNLPKQYRKYADSFVNNGSGFFEILPPIEGALEGILKLAEKNPVYICTSPNTVNDSCASGKIRSIREHLGIEWVRRTIITKDKTIIHGDYLIDDKPEITGAFERTWKHILYDQPYNRHIQTNYRFNWTEGLFNY